MPTTNGTWRATRRPATSSRSPFVDDALFQSRTFDSADALRRFLEQNLADPKLYATESGEPFQSVWQRAPW